jgi:hypothetical protein
MRTLYLLLLLATVLNADQVTLKNGDRLTGSVVKKDDKTLTFDSPVVGKVTMPWDQVASLTTDAPVTVELTSGQKSQATVQSVPMADISTIRNAAEESAYERLQHPSWLQLWNGNALIGFAGTAGNATTRTFTTTAGASRTTENDKTTLYFNSVRASATANQVSSTTAQAVRGGAGYNHKIYDRLFVNTTADFEYDLFQDLDLRYVLGGGLGYSIWRADRKSLSVVGGVAYDHAKFSPKAVPAYTRTAADFYWVDDFAYKVTPASSLVQSFRMYNNFSDSQDFRANFDVTSSTKIGKWFTWNLGFSFKYLNDPAPGRKTNDILYTTGLGIVFNR